MKHKKNLSIIKMNILPNVSVLIPTYNRRKFLDLCMDNIIKQSYPKNKLEIVIIDDGEEKLIIDELKIRKLLFPIKLKYIKIDNKYQLKIGDKRNYLVQNASNDYLINMDDDDIYLNNYILKSILYLLMKNVGLVGSNQMIFYFYKYNKFTKIKCVAKRQIHEATMCFTKKHFYKTGGFFNKNIGEGPKMIDHHEKDVYNLTINELMYCICHDENSYSKDNFLSKTELKIKLDSNKLKIIKAIFYN